MNTLQAILARAKIRQPDHVIPAIWLDGAVRWYEGVKLPFKEPKETKYYLYGCYLWFQSEISSGQTEILYAGKAARLYNRLQQYWNNTIGPRFLKKWLEWTEENGEPFIPCVAVWVCDDSDEFERKLISKLQPRYNTNLRNNQPIPAKKMLAPTDQSQQLRLFERDAGYLL